MVEEYEDIQEADLPRWEGSGDIYLIRPLAHVGPSWAMLYLAKSRPIKTIRASASARCNKVRLCWRIHALGFPSFIAFFLFSSVIVSQGRLTSGTVQSSPFCFLSVCSSISSFIFSTSPFSDISTQYLLRSQSYLSFLAQDVAVSLLFPKKVYH